MRKLERSDLATLESYDAARDDFRGRVLVHKRSRRVALGGSVTLLFEDRMTVQYQVQEMLRMERIFEARAIEQELDAYNPLIPDGSNLKATMLLEIANPELRRRELARLVGIERSAYAHVVGCAPVTAIADEDLERSNASKTAAVHFLRFEFAPAMVAALRAGAQLAFGIGDERLRIETPVSPAVREALLADFEQIRA